MKRTDNQKTFTRSAAVMALGALVIIFTACAKNSSTSSATGTDDVFGVFVQTVESQTVRRVITVSGVAHSLVSAGVKPGTTGLLTKIAVSRGDMVKKGQVVAYLNASKAGSTFLSGPITAPVSGQIASIDAEAGNEVTPQQSIAQIVDNTQLELRVALSERDARFISEGTRGTLMFPSLAARHPGKTTGAGSHVGETQSTFDISVFSVSNVLAEKSGTMRISVRLKNPNPADGVRSGMYGKMRLVLQENNDTIAIDKNIIVNRLIDGTAVEGVFVFDNPGQETGTVSFYPITRGIEDEDGVRVQVFGKLKTGDEVIVQGHKALADKSVVKIFQLLSESGDSVDSGNPDNRKKDMGGK